MEKTHSMPAHINFSNLQIFPELARKLSNRAVINLTVVLYSSYLSHHVFFIESCVSPDLDQETNLDLSEQ